MGGFDFDEAYQRISSAVEDATGRVRVGLIRYAGARVVSVQVGVGAKGCVGCFHLTRHNNVLSIRRGMSYCINFNDLDVRRSLVAMWSECDRQGAMWQ